jgi:hypothetical protein
MRYSNIPTGVYDNEQHQQRSRTDIALIPPAYSSYCPCPEVTINDNNRLLLVTFGKSQRPERPFISIYTTYKRQETLIEIAFSEKNRVRALRRKERDQEIRTF